MPWFCPKYGITDSLPCNENPKLMCLLGNLPCCDTIYSYCIMVAIYHMFHTICSLDNHDTRKEGNLISRLTTFECSLTFIAAIEPLDLLIKKTCYFQSILKLSLLFRWHIDFSRQSKYCCRTKVYLVLLYHGYNFITYFGCD